MDNRHVLARSDNYEVSHEFETIYLYRYNTKKPENEIGDFYGDPTAAVIDEKERFVIMAGHGLIIYNLQEPFDPYEYDVQTSQWRELLRESADPWDVENIVQQNEDTFHFTVEPYSDKSGTYELTFPDLLIRKIELPDGDE